MALCRHALGSPSSTRRSLQVPVVVISTASYSALPQGVNPVYRSGDRACFLQRPSSTSPPLRPGLHSSTVLRAAPVVIDDAAAQHPEPATKLPVTIITGFLGSGKTTLLNNILTNKAGKRVAVIENEFGAIDIDSELVALREKGPQEDQPELLMTLDNGCACCTVNENFVEILFNLIDRREEFDQIVIETTGLANPHSIIRTFSMVQEVWDTMQLDAVVTLVDAKHIERQLDEKKPEGVDNEALKQLAYADRVVLNKVDLVGEQDLQRIEKRIHGINTWAQLRRAKHANIGIDFVLDLQAFSADRMEAMSLEEAAQAVHHHHDHNDQHDDDRDVDHAHAHAHEHGHSHDHLHADHGHSHGHLHDDSIKSFAISQPGLLDMDKLQTWLQTLMTAATFLYRYKGILAVKDSDRGDFLLVLQGVHELVEATEKPMQPGQEPQSKMVFIGKELDEIAIRNSFEACAAS